MFHIYVFIFISIVDFYCSGNFISVLLRLKVGELGSDKMAATTLAFYVQSLICGAKHDRF